LLLHPLLWSLQRSLLRLHIGVKHDLLCLLDLLSSNLHLLGLVSITHLCMLRLRIRLHLLHLLQIQGLLLLLLLYLLHLCLLELRLCEGCNLTIEGMGSRLGLGRDLVHGT
jgi:hypothetical protein